jgi:hypothetical protein
MMTRCPLCQGDVPQSPLSMYGTAVAHINASTGTPCRRYPHIGRKHTLQRQQGNLERFDLPVDDHDDHVFASYVTWDDLMFKACIENALANIDLPVYPEMKNARLIPFKPQRAQYHPLAVLDNIARAVA